MAQCQKCGISLTENDGVRVKEYVFCQDCYAKLRQEYKKMKVAAQRKPDLTCRVCGQTSPSGSLHCAACGAFLLSETEIAEVSNQEKLITPQAKASPLIKEVPEPKKAEPKTPEPKPAEPAAPAPPEPKAAVKKTPEPKKPAPKKAIQKKAPPRKGTKKKHKLTKKGAILFSFLAVVVLSSLLLLGSVFLLPELKYRSMLSGVSSVDSLNHAQVFAAVKQYQTDYPKTRHMETLKAILKLFEESDRVEEKVARYNTLKENQEIFTKRLETADMYYQASMTNFEIIRSSFDNINCTLSANADPFLADWKLNAKTYEKILVEVSSEKFDKDTKALSPDFINVINNIKDLLSFEQRLAEFSTRSENASEEEKRAIAVTFDRLNQQLSQGSSEKTLQSVKAEMADIKNVSASAQEEREKVYERIRAINF